MSDPILLLSGPEEGPFLTAKLQACVGCGPVDVVHTKPELIEACSLTMYRNVQSARLIAFCTDVIVPEKVLSVFQGGAYNFHPGSADYPGSNAASFAIYDQVSTYGVTAHEMEVSVDSGLIVGFEEFTVPADARFLDLEILAFQNLLNLFDRLTPDLVVTNIPLNGLSVQWGAQKRTHHDFEQMRIVTDDMDENEIRRRWRAFG